MMWRFLFILLFFLPSSVFGQALNIKYIGDSYNPSVSPVDTCIVYDFIPNINISTANVHLANVKSVNYSDVDFDGFSAAYGGWHKDITIDGVIGYRQIWFADSENVYSFYRGLSNQPYIDKFFSESALAPFNLSTVVQRNNAISFLHYRFDVVPVNFASNSGRWLLIGIAISIAILPFWWVVRRFLR